MAGSNVKKIEQAPAARPILNRDFGLSQHRMQRFDCSVHNDTTREQLTDPALWVNVGPQMQEGAEIRVMDFNRSWVADLICIYAAGNRVVMAEKSFTKLAALTPEDVVNEIDADYKVERRQAPDGWCVIQTSTGDIISSGHGSQSAAMRSREEHLSILRR